MITGGAGFIGSHLARLLLDQDHDVVLLDNFDSLLYPVALKEQRLTNLFSADERPRLLTGDILDVAFMDTVFAEEKFAKVIHLAALANPAVSLKVADRYTMVNVMGTLRVLEMCQKHDISQLIFAGSSSVYNDQQTPFAETSYPLRPNSPYGASKAAAETYCEMWHGLHGIPITILRFFSVYGPWGRPDMAPMIFARQILHGETLTVTKDRQRDFTYVGDIVAGISAAIDKRLEFEIINLGRGDPVDLTEFIAALEKAAGRKAKIQMRDAPPGEMRVTFANTKKAKDLLGYEPKVSVADGAHHIIDWLKQQNSK